VEARSTSWLGVEAGSASWLGAAQQVLESGGDTAVGERRGGSELDGAGGVAVGEQRATVGERRDADLVERRAGAATGGRGCHREVGSMAGDGGVVGSGGRGRRRGLDRGRRRGPVGRGLSGSAVPTYFFRSRVSICRGGRQR
jgi:hypothetical protein